MTVKNKIKKKTVKQKLNEGGLFVGPSHAEGGIKFNIERTGELVEVEGEGKGEPNEHKLGEFLVCNNAMANDEEKVYKGKPAEILDEMNSEHGCNGLNEKAEKIKGGESVINRRSVSMDSEFECEGTPEGIASAINELDGRGKKFSSKGKCKLIKKAVHDKELAKDGVIVAEEGKMATGGKTGVLKAPNGEHSNLNPVQYKLVRTKQFKRWFGDWEKDPENSSKVVDENGEPLVVYHGTTHKFTIFTTEKSNIENDFGKAYYFSSNKTDAKVNYNEEGQDITQRVERLTERLQAEDDISKDKALKKAKQILVGGKAKVLDVFLNIRNPLIIGGNKETYLDSDYNPEEGVESGKLIEFAEALRKASWNYEEVRIDETISEIFDNHSGGDNISSILDTLKKSQGLVYASDENGDLASNEIIRSAFEKMGYDGIIDTTVSKKWGYDSGRRNPMEGVGSSTKHLVVFESSQVKLADGKNKKFDPNSPDIRLETGGLTDFESLSHLRLDDKFYDDKAREVIDRTFPDDKDRIIFMNRNSVDEYGMDIITYVFSVIGGKGLKLPDGKMLGSNKVQVVFHFTQHATHIKQYTIDVYLNSNFVTRYNFKDFNLENGGLTGLENIPHIRLDDEFYKLKAWEVIYRTFPHDKSRIVFSNIDTLNDFEYDQIIVSFTTHDRMPLDVPGRTFPGPIDKRIKVVFYFKDTVATKENSINVYVNGSFINTYSFKDFNILKDGGLTDFENIPRIRMNDEFYEQKALEIAKETFPEDANKLQLLESKSYEHRNSYYYVITKKDSQYFTGYNSDFANVVLNFDFNTIFVLIESTKKKTYDFKDFNILENGGKTSDEVAVFKKVPCKHQIFAVIAENSNKLSRIFVRIGEHYDGSKFKDKIFSLDEFKDYWKSGHDGKFTYYDWWFGFNVPDYSIKAFTNGDFDPLLLEEKWLVDNIKSKVDTSKPFYIVGYATGNDPVRRHELAHALYYLSPEYKKAVDAVIDSIPKSELETLTKFLDARHYHKSVYKDEMQAYLLADKKFLQEQNGWKDSYEKYRKKLNDIFDASDIPGGKKLDKLENGGKTDDFANSNKNRNFIQNINRDELRNIISGNGKVSNGENIQAAARYLRGSQGAGSLAKDSKLYKRQEERSLKEYISKNNLWVSDVYKNYIGEGAEQKVYLIKGKYVIKLNDSIFYNSWEDYFNSLLLHNYFFPANAYKLIGFIEKDDTIFAVIKQNYIKIKEKTNLDNVKKFITKNGFINTKNNDYYNPELGIILEDLHDENVLTEDGVLQFIDTVFYIKDNLYIKQNGGKLKNAELNNKGGYDYTDQKDKKTADRCGLITLPENITGTNCGNCIFQKNNFCDHKALLLPVTSRMCCSFWDSKSLTSIITNLPKADFFPDKTKSTAKLNAQGGYDYSGKELEKAKKADLITLPQNVEGTNCGVNNCIFGGNICTHPKIKLPVTERQSCGWWNNEEVIRPWGKAVDNKFLIGGPVKTTIQDNKKTTNSDSEIKIKTRKKEYVLPVGDITAEKAIKTVKYKYPTFTEFEYKGITYKKTGIKGEFLKKIEPPEVIEARWKKKKERIHTIANDIQKLRNNVSRDLKSDDEKTFLTAIIISIIDRTAERIGNSESEKDGHFGVTGFKKSHATIIGNKILFCYTGKSGVDHEKAFSDERICKALRKAIKNSPSKFIFTTTDGIRIRSSHVNDYLKEFGITAKDLRGFASNKWMMEGLKKIETIEDSDKKRKGQFNKVLKMVAAKVGHGPSTLRKHYLMPELIDEFINNGKILDIKEYRYQDGGRIPDISIIRKVYDYYNESAAKGKPITEEQLEELMSLQKSGKIHLDILLFISNNGEMPFNELMDGIKKIADQKALFEDLPEVELERENKETDKNNPHKELAKSFKTQKEAIKYSEERKKDGIKTSIYQFNNNWVVGSYYKDGGLIMSDAAIKKIYEFFIKEGLSAPYSGETKAHVLLINRIREAILENKSFKQTLEYVKGKAIFEDIPEMEIEDEEDRRERRDRELDEIGRRRDEEYGHPVKIIGDFGSEYEAEKIAYDISKRDNIETFVEVLNNGRWAVLVPEKYRSRYKQGGTIDWENMPKIDLYENEIRFTKKDFDKLIRDNFFKKQFQIAYPIENQLYEIWLILTDENRMFSDEEMNVGKWDAKSKTLYLTQGKKNPLRIWLIKNKYIQMKNGGITDWENMPKVDLGDNEIKFTQKDFEKLIKGNFLKRKKFAKSSNVNNGIYTIEYNPAVIAEDFIHATKYGLEVGKWDSKNEILITGGNYLPLSKINPLVKWLIKNKYIEMKDGGNIDFDKIPYIDLGIERDMLEDFYLILESIVGEYRKKLYSTAVTALEAELQYTKWLLAGGVERQGFINLIGHYRIIFNNLLANDFLSKETIKQINSQIARADKFLKGNYELRKMKNGGETDSVRTLAVGALPGDISKQAEDNGWEFISGDLVEGSDEYWDLVSAVGGAKAKQLLGKGVTIRKKLELDIK